MKILFDHQMFLKQKYGGITKYFCELMKNLPGEDSYELSVLFADNQHLKDYHFKKINISLPTQDFRGKGRLKTYFYNINKAYSKYKISSKRYDLLHPTYYDPYFLENLKKPYVVTVHDLIEFKFKRQYEKESLIPQMEKIIKKANRIISISENTKKDLIELLNIQPEKIDVVYHGYTHPAISEKTNLFGRYILFVGYRAGYKNFFSVANVFSNLIIKDTDLKLICVGQPFTTGELNELSHLKISKNIQAIGASEDLLNQLYSNALVFVYPTKYEGFGMPVLEAFANNCPLCVSNSSSLPEVAGNAAEYFDPYDKESIQIAIEKVIYDKVHSNKLIEAGKQQLKKFSWKKCALSTTETYKKLL